MSTEARNGVPAGKLAPAAWRKSSHSGKEGNCVELAHLAGGETAMRDSKTPDGPTLVCPARHLAAFVVAAKAGDFDGVRG